MPEKNEQISQKNSFSSEKKEIVDASSFDMGNYRTQKIQVVPKERLMAVLSTVETPLPVAPTIPTTPTINPPYVVKKKRTSTGETNRDLANARTVQERCQHLCLSLFFREHDPVRSLGFTSAIGGEGKSFLSVITAHVLAHDSSEPVTLIECNWEHPNIHEYFNIPPTPGLAEWLRGTASVDEIRYQVAENLSVIPAGQSMQNDVRLLKRIQQQGFPKQVSRSNELFIVELPPILTTGYGTLAADLLEAVVIVVHARATTDSMVVETCAQLKDAPVHGLILNQDTSHIPRWIRQLL